MTTKAQSSPDIKWQMTDTYDYTYGDDAILILHKNKKINNANFIKIHLTETDLSHFFYIYGSTLFGILIAFGPFFLIAFGTKI